MHADQVAEFDELRGQFDRPIDYELVLRLETRDLPLVIEQLMSLDRVYFNPVEWAGTMAMMNWVSTGAEVDFYIGEKDGYQDWVAERKTSEFPDSPTDDSLRIYTTRPDTLFGATYMVIAPEHHLVDSLTSEEQQSAVQEYCQQASFKSDRERQDEKRKKSGVFTGSYADPDADSSKIIESDRN